VLHDDPEQSLALQLQLRDEIGFDSPPFYLHATYGTWEHAAGLGFASSELREQPTEPHYPVQQASNLGDLRLPDPLRAGMLPTALRFSELQAEAGLPVSVVLGGVFTIAANLCGMQQLFAWMLEQPRLVGRLLERSGDHLLEVAELWAARFGAARVRPIVWEGMANARWLSHRQFETFVLPGQRRLHEGLLALGMGPLLLHACGEQEAVLDLWARLPMGADAALSLGHEVPISRASAHFPQLTLVGNVDPRLLAEADAQTVRDTAERCIEAGLRHPGGFVLAPGCVLDRAVPDANLRALVDAARSSSSGG
jgi:uroporphyrinogen decarboxylase